MCVESLEDVMAMCVVMSKCLTSDVVAIPTAKMAEGFKIHGNSPCQFFFKFFYFLGNLLSCFTLTFLLIIV